MRKQLMLSLFILSCSLAFSEAGSSTKGNKTIPPVFDYMAMNTTSWDGNLHEIRRLSKALGLKTVAAVGAYGGKSGDGYREDLLFLINDPHKNIQPEVDLNLSAQELKRLQLKYPYTLSFYPQITRGIKVPEFDQMRREDPEIFHAYRKKFEATKIWANTDKPFPSNIAQLQTWGNSEFKGDSAFWEPCPDFQQQVVIDDLVKGIVDYAKSEEIPEKNWLFKGLIIDVIEIWKEFNWNSHRGIPGHPESERYAVPHEGVRHDYATLREGWYHFLAQLRDALEEEFPGRGIKYVWEPTPVVDSWVIPLFEDPYPSMDAAMIQKIKGDVIVNEKPGLRFLMNEKAMFAEGRWNRFQLGSTTPDLFARGPYYPLQLKYFGEIAMRGGHFVIYGGWDRELNYKINSKARWNSLIRALSSWEMLNQTAIEDRIYDSEQRIYISPTAYADVNVTAGVHPENGHLYAVFHNAEGRLNLSNHLSLGEISLVNAYWEAAEWADDSFEFKRGILRPRKDASFPLDVIIELKRPVERNFSALPGVELKRVFSIDNLYEKDIYDAGFEEGGVGWESGGHAKVVSVTEPVAEGSHSVVIVERGKAWHGLFQNITGYLMQHLQGVYRISAKVQPKAVDDEFRIGIRFIEKDESVMLTGKRIKAKAGEWTTIEATVALDWNDWIESGYLDLRRTHPDDDFYVDDVRIEQIEKGRGLSQ